MMTQHVAHRASDEVAQGNGIAALSRELFDTMRFAAARGMSKSDLRAASDIALRRMFGPTIIDRLWDRDKEDRAADHYGT